MTGGADAHQGLLVSGRFPELEDALAKRVLEIKNGRPLAPRTRPDRVIRSPRP